MKINCNFAPATYFALKCVGEGKSAAQFAREWGVSRPSGWKRFEVLRAKKLIFSGKPDRSSVRFYYLSDSGRFVRDELRRTFGGCNLDELRRKDTELSGQWREHDLMLEFRLVRVPANFHSALAALLEKKGGVFVSRGWMKGVPIAFEGAEIFFAGNAVFVFPAPVHAPNAALAVRRALEFGLKVKEFVEAKFGVRLSAEEYLCRQQLACEGNTNDWVPDGFTYFSHILIIDFSTGRGEVEFTHKKLALQHAERYAIFIESLVSKPAILPAIIELPSTLAAYAQAFEHLNAQLELISARISSVERKVG